MALCNPSELDGFDAERALDAARSSVGDSLRVCIEYDAERFTTLYADGTLLELYGDEEMMLEQFAEVHSYVHVDFTERDLFEDLFYGAGDVRAFVTCMEHTTAVRCVTGEFGLFLGLDPDAAVTPVVEAVERVLADG